jgi:hypothetical protein
MRQLAAVLIVGEFLDLGYHFKSAIR